MVTSTFCNGTKELDRSNFKSFLESYINQRKPVSINSRVSVPLPSSVNKKASSYHSSNLELLNLVYSNEVSYRIRMHNISKRELKELWKEYSLHIRNSLLQGKSVVVPSFGIFALSGNFYDIGKYGPIVKSVPIFILSEKFTAEHGIRASIPNTLSKGIVVSSFKSKVIHSAQVVDDILRDVFKCFGLCSQGFLGFSNKSSLEFCGLCRLHVNNCIVSVEWSTNFLNSLATKDEKSFNSYLSTMPPAHMKSAKRNKKILQSIISKRNNANKNVAK